ncbi:MAG: cytochrome c biogenesis protein CcsA [Gammaproteobacteria bacterium]|nr:cytochrome c biogenesis protein CcsA [Gammaproteobacteria bacterium]
MTILLFATIATYGIALFALIARVVYSERGGLPSSSALYLRYISLVAGGVAVVLHGFLLSSQLLIQDEASGEIGLYLTLLPVLSLTAWVMNLVIVTSAWWKSVENLGLMSFPFALLAIVAFAGLESPAQLTMVESGVRYHILISILSYSVLGIAALQAVLLAIEDYQLRHRKLSGFIRLLPPLETMEQLLFQLIAVGYILLSLSLLSGATYVEDLFAQHLVHKSVLSVVSWVVFALLLWGRMSRGWRGRTAIRWTLSGFGVLMVAYLGSKFVLERLLS